MRSKFLYLLLLHLLAGAALQSQVINKGIFTIDTTGILEVGIQGSLSSSGTFINNGVLNIAGQLTNNTNMIGIGKVVLKDPQFQSVIVDGTGSIPSLEINTASTAYIEGTQGISDVLLLTKGTVQITGTLKLVSNASRTARVAPVGSGSVSGPISVERYIPAGRYWRLLTAPVSYGDTIRKTWQNNKIYAAGKGTFIKGPGGSNGLDTGATASFMTYNAASQQMVAVTNTNVPISVASPSAANRGYFAFITGDRNPLNQTVPNTNATTLTATGNLQTGNQKFYADQHAGYKTLVGNPYPSPVDFNALIRSNIKKRFYAWDADLNNVGGYVLIDDADNNGIYTVTPASNLTNIIQSGQAILVETGVLGTASITFTEASKVTGSSLTPFKQSESIPTCIINLHRNNGEDKRPIDGVAAYYSNNFDNEIDEQDASKMMNPFENIAIARGNQQLSLEKRKLPAAADELPLYLDNLCEGAYEFRIGFKRLDKYLSAYLVDDLAMTTTPLSLQGENIVLFKIETAHKAMQANRFRIVYKKETAATIARQLASLSTDNVGAASIYPNPSNGKTFNLHMRSEADVYNLAIFDAAGKRLFAKQLMHNGGNTNYPITVGTRLPAGLYHVSISSTATKQHLTMIVE